MDENKYLHILDFIQEFGGEKYKKAEKCKNDSEVSYMQRGSISGKAAREAFALLVNEIENHTSLIAGKITQWQNSGTFVRYFWCQLKRPEYSNSNISISLFAESANNVYQFRVSVEIANEKSEGTEKDQYKKILDIPLKDNLNYVLGSNDASTLSVLDIRSNEEVKKLNAKKIQISKVIGRTLCFSENKIISEIISGANDLLEYYDYALNQNEWWPSQDEYTPNFTKEDWSKILNNPAIIGPIWGEVLAMFYTEPDGVSCSSLAKKYNIENPTSIISRCTQLAKKIHQITNCSIVENVENAKYWPILFLGKNNKSVDTYEWKLRSELYEALTDFGIEKYLPSTANTWLLTWNPRNWEWKDFDSKKKTIANGGEYVDEWACSNSHVKIGDRIFMTMLGMSDENGIFASGTVVKEPFQAPHYDEEKKKQGITIQKVKVKFDVLLDYKNEKILKQTQLNDLFPDQKWNPQGSGIEIKAIYRKRLEEEWAKLTGKEETVTMTNKEKVNTVKSFISSKGFTYPDNLIENFYLSLKSKPFVILAGTSGTGKTRLVRLFAEAINAEYKLVPVRPDWSDSSDLFGHVNLNDKFVSGAIIDFIKEANDNPSKPYILCLDEMNLARVEYYLSDFLSIIETRDMKDGIIVTDPLISIDKYGIDMDAIEKYGELSFPENLYVVGTVNMDETTFPFSKKVLDRANTIEFNYVDLMPSFSGSEVVEKISVDNTFLRSQYLKLAECTGEDEFINATCKELQSINSILQSANLHIGYRVRDEIVFYLLNNKNSENLITYNDAFDNQLLQKILPRVQGSSESIRTMLCKLFKHIADDFELANGNSDSEKMQKIIDDNKCKYPKSAAKIQMMISRFEDDGFTSYWL